MSKYSKQMIELQAWQEFELEYLIEPEPPLDPSYAGINWEDPDLWDLESGTDIGRNPEYVEVIYEDDFDYWYDDIEDYISIDDYGYVDFDDYTDWDNRNDD
jgi:hypothetical protein